MRYMDANKIIWQYVYMCAALRSGHQEESHGTHAVIGWECAYLGGTTTRFLHNISPLHFVYGRPGSVAANLPMRSM